MPVRLSSTRLKASVKPALVLAKRAVAEGRAAVRASRKAAKKNPTGAAKAAVRKNERLLEKATVIVAGLKGSEKLANSMCPLQVMFIEFKYIRVV